MSFADELTKTVGGASRGDALFMNQPTANLYVGGASRGDALFINQPTANLYVGGASRGDALFINQQFAAGTRLLRVRELR